MRGYEENEDPSAGFQVPVPVQIQTLIQTLIRCTTSAHHFSLTCDVARAPRRGA